MTTTTETLDAIENAINALGLAKIAIAKSAALPVDGGDVLRKANLPALDMGEIVLGLLAHAERRLEALEASRPAADPWAKHRTAVTSDLDGQTVTKKTWRPDSALESLALRAIKP